MKLAPCVILLNQTQTLQHSSRCDVREENSDLETYCRELHYKIFKDKTKQQNLSAFFEPVSFLHFFLSTHACLRFTSAAHTLLYPSKYFQVKWLQSRFVFPVVKGNILKLDSHYFSDFLRYGNTVWIEH